MSKASEELADVRGWLCDNLSEGDAGKACGMLSVVSRHIVELEDENAELRGQINELKKLVWQYNSALNCLLKTGICTRQCVACWTFMNPAWLENHMRELGIEV